MIRAQKLQSKAGQVGFDWNDPQAVLAKIREETAEIATALTRGDRSAAGQEVGDLLFAAVNLARHLDQDAESLLRSTNQKFERRFGAIEAALARQGRTTTQASLQEMDALWDAAKQDERTNQAENATP
jgi:ATP diphosphatase